MRMKGDGEPEIAIGTIIFITGLLLLSLLIFSRFTDFDAVIKTDVDRIEMVNFAHLAQKCFENDEGMLTESGIKSHKKEGCGIGGIKVCIRDIENNKKWLDCGDVDDPGHTIYVPLLVEGVKVHVGELSVQE